MGIGKGRGGGGEVGWHLAGRRVGEDGVGGGGIEEMGEGGFPFLAEVH